MKSSLLSAVTILCLALLAAWAQKTANVPEIHRLFLEDQKDRENLTTQEQWEKVNVRDKQRRDRTRQLLDAGELKTGQDFHDAAFIFQHGDTPDDYLLAHILATVGVAKGNSYSRWIAAATLDRYLQSIQKPQIFGTQFSNTDSNPLTQEPYNRILLSDSLRKEFCVSSQRDQEQTLAIVNHGGEFKSTNICQ